MTGKGPNIRDIYPYCSRISGGKVGAALFRMDGSLPFDTSSTSSNGGPFLENWSSKFP